ncbi:MAG: M13 family metallopeptidase [Acidobacteria bacterium]|nr:M13 family metallopeptidase [Acidobacteriota bacterium]
MRAVALIITLLALAPVSPLSSQSSASILAVDSSRFDTTCAPCQDFFRYANGGWAARTEIPPQYISFGPGREIQDRTEALLHEILEEATREAPRTTDSTVRLVGMFYGSCMDSVRGRREDAAPLEPLEASVYGKDPPSPGPMSLEEATVHSGPLPPGSAVPRPSLGSLADERCGLLIRLRSSV